MSTHLAKMVHDSFNNQPSMIAPSQSQSLCDTIRDLRTVNIREEEANAVDRKIELLSAFGQNYDVGMDKPFAYANGIAYIPITGLLINRCAYAWSFLTGYNAIRMQMQAALQDNDVKYIIYDCNSGGGQVAGCFELADEIFASRDVKPSAAIIDSTSYSAAYALASAAGKMYVTPSGDVGSIGVVAMHMDRSKMMEDIGVTVTFIYSGDHKVDGNPYEKLPSSVKADIQKSVDTVREKFVSVVARNRGLDAQVVYETEARCYSAAEALELGLVDAIAAPIDAAFAFIEELNGSDTSDNQENEMSTTTQNPGADQAAADQQANTQNVDKTARANERARISAIQGCEEAVGRTALANHLALNTEMSVDEAKAMLAVAAKETQAAATTAEASSFEKAMNADKHPEVGADTEGQDKKAEVTSDADISTMILQSQALATGKDPKAVKLH